MSDNCYSVYKHTCPNNKVYIGITRQKPEARWANGHGYYTQLFGRAVKKYGWENIVHEVLYENLSEHEAKRIEEEIISKLDSQNPEHGYNMTAGGDGAKGHVVTNEQREKIRESTAKMWRDPEMREHLTQHLHEISRANIGRKIDPDIVKKRAEKLSIKVDQYTRDGTYIQTFGSLADAARSIRKETNSAIVACCKGNRKSYFGFIWKYHGEELTGEHLEWSNSRNFYNKREIVMCDDEWNEIRRFPGFHDAGRELGLNYKGIFHACKTGGRCGGYKWRYAI